MNLKLKVKAIRDCKETPAYLLETLKNYSNTDEVWLSFLAPNQESLDSSILKVVKEIIKRNKQMEDLSKTELIQKLTEAEENII